MRSRELGGIVALPLVLAGGMAGSPRAQTPGSGSPPPPPTCAGSEYHQFDFWIGDWNVTSGGRQAGTNNVTLDVAGCVIHEHWAGAQGGTGESFNFYDRADGKWHQVWISSGGGVARFDGEYRDGRMAFTGKKAGGKGRSQSTRMTFFNNEADRTVRQLWETSPDEGVTWQVAFDG